MIIRNRSEYPTGVVRDLVKFATQEVDMRHVCVNVKRMRQRGWRGWAYEGVPSVSNANPTADYLVTLAVGPNDYPVKVKQRRRGEPYFELNDWREAMVFLAAHEGKHIEQYKETKPRSEVACNNFAVYMLNRFRAEANP